MLTIPPQVLICLVKKIGDLSSKILPPAIYEEMDVIHTSLLHELQSKGEGDKETLEKLHKNRVRMLESYLAVTNIALQQVAKQTCTSNVPINSSIRDKAGMMFCPC